MNQKLNITTSTKIYVACPANVATGGPELLHQLVYNLNMIGVDAYMHYFNTTEGISPVERAYAKYQNKYTDTVEDSNKNYYIVPEISFAMHLVNSFTSINKVIWWLSVDNHYLPRLVTNKKYFLFQRIINKIMRTKVFDIENLALKKFLNSDRSMSEEIFKNIKYHFYQSYYAQKFLEDNRIENENIYRLSDYLNEDFLKIKTSTKTKENIVAYNPKKGYQFTKKIIEKARDIKFVPIENMTRAGVIELLQKSKVYIDFGNHPGKDRIPREAAILKCCIITNRQGSAKFHKDLPIDDKYKFDDSFTNIDNIIKKINYCLNNFDNAYKDFEAYVDFIINEQEVFLHDLQNIFELQEGNS